MHYYLLWGQTALNVSLEISNSGFLEKNNVELIGANKEAISKAENREEFEEFYEFNWL